MDNVATAVEMRTGLDREARIDLSKDILMGQIPENDEQWSGLRDRGITREAALGSVNQAVQIGQAAAARELRHADYQELTRLADNSAAVKGLVILHGVKRMTGKTNRVTWKHVLTLARQLAKA